MSVYQLAGGTGKKNSPAHDMAITGMLPTKPTNTALRLQVTICILFEMLKFRCLKCVNTYKCKPFEICQID